VIISFPGYRVALFGKSVGQTEEAFQKMFAFYAGMYGTKVKEKPPFYIAGTDKNMNIDQGSMYKK
jgi:hypothetical protein